MLTGTGILARGRGWCGSFSPRVSARTPTRSRVEPGRTSFHFSHWSERSRSFLRPDWESARAETIAKLQTIIRFDPRNPPGNERPLAVYIEAILREEGIETRLLPQTKNRAQVMGRI